MPFVRIAVNSFVQINIFMQNLFLLQFSPTFGLFYLSDKIPLSYFQLFIFLYIFRYFDNT